jgi:hypothetical protein
LRKFYAKEIMMTLKIKPFVTSLLKEAKDDAESLQAVNRRHILIKKGDEGDFTKVAITDGFGTELDPPGPGFIPTDQLEGIPLPVPTSEDIDLPGFVLACTVAAQQLSADRDFLLAQAWVKSGIKNKVADSGEIGPFQYTRETWNALIETAGGKLGVGQSGIVSPAKQAVFAAHLSANAMNKFEQSQGRLPSYAELFLWELLPSGIELAVLKAPRDTDIDKIMSQSLAGTPNAEVILQGTIAANEQFFRGGGRVRTIEEVLKAIADKVGEGLAGAVKLVSASAPGDQGIGTLSARFESAGRGPGTIGNPTGDDPSYGTHQISTKAGTMVDFMKYLETNEPPFFKRLSDAGGEPAAKGGKDEFKAAWTDLARDPKFGDVQFDFIKTTHYDVQVKKLLSEASLDVSSRSNALKNVVFSVSVHHGGRTPMIVQALQGKDPKQMMDAEIIKAIYAKRSDPETIQTQFPKASDRVRRVLAKRFDDERLVALEMLA